MLHLLFAVSFLIHPPAALDSIATQDVPAGAPGIATAIIRNGDVFYSRVAGYADLSDSTLITPESRFNIASNGKQFTALAVLLLADQQRLRLSDDIRVHLPGLFPSIAEPITITHLLTHTSGIRDVYDLMSLQGLTWWEQAFGNHELLNLLRKQTDLNFPPGSRHMYSNSNYILLARIIEAASGESFTAFTDAMFRRLGMPNTSFVDDASAIRGPIARSYFNFNTWTTYDWIWSANGDGNLFSSLSDQIQWEKVLQGGASTDIPKAVIEESQTRIPESIANYGFGLEFGEYKGLEVLFHEGATGAWKATVLRFPQQNTAIITLTNTGKSVPAMQTRQMVDVVFRLKPDREYLVTRPSGDGARVEEADVVGTYLTPENFAFRFDLVDGRMVLKRVGRNDVELVRESDHVFHQTYDPDFKQEFRLTNEGVMTVTAYHTSHSPYTLKKVVALDESFHPGTLNGTYTNSEVGVSIRLTHQSGTDFEVVFRDEYRTTGILVSESKLLVDYYVLDVSNDRLMLSGGRLGNVVFWRE